MQRVVRSNAARAYTIIKKNEHRKGGWADLVKFRISWLITIVNKKGERVLL